LAWGVSLYRTLQGFEGSLALSTQARTIREFSPLWGPFFDHTVPAVVVFGSPAFFASDEHQLFLRMHGMKDPDDPRSSPRFAEVNRRVGPLLGPRFDYASMGDAIAIQRLTAFFGSAGVSLRALPAHRATWESIKDGNLIFVGAWRMHPLLRRIPIEQDFELGDGNVIYNRKPQAGEEREYSTPSHRDSMTYAVVGSFPGLKPGHQVFVVNAHSSPGSAGAVEFLTTPGNIQTIQERVGLSTAGPRKYFQMLLRIYVDNDVPMKIEYVTHHVNATANRR
jgi:hypothetical protein